MREYADKCDMCPKVKGTTNNWFIVNKAYDRETSLDGTVLYVWNEEMAERGMPQLCGQECATKYFQQWMSKQCEAVPA